MNYPPELYIVYDPQATQTGEYTDFTEIKSHLAEKFDGIVINELSFKEALKMLSNSSIKPFRVILLLTDYILPENKTNIQPLLYRINQSQTGLIMHPSSVSTNPNHLQARTIKGISESLTKLGFQMNFSGTHTALSSQTTLVGTSPRSTSQFRSTSNLTSVSNLGSSPKLGVVIFGSSNQIFMRDMNLLYNRYGNDPRIRISEVRNLSQIPVIPGNEYYIFVSQEDANIFIPQLASSAGRPDRFIPILYNTSSRMIRADNHFSISISDLNRAYAEIDNRLNAMNAITSTSTIPPAILTSQIPTGIATGALTTTSMVPGGMIPGNIASGVMTSNTLIQNPMTTTSMTTGGNVRLFVLDSGNLYFEQFYRTLPAQYQLLDHLEPNSEFAKPTLLLAAYETKDHILSNIDMNSPLINNIGLVFYSQVPTSINHRLVRLVSSNPRQIEQFLLRSGVSIRTLEITGTTVMRNNTLYETNSFGRQSHIIGGQGLGNTIVLNNQLNNWGTSSLGTKEWVVRRFPGSHKYDTYLSDQEHLFQNRSMVNTRLGGSLESNHNFYEIKQIPNQSQVRVNQTILNSPPRNTVYNQVTETSRTIVPIQLAQTVTEQIYEENTISVKNRPQSNFHQEQSIQQITIDQIPIMETVPLPPPPPVIQPRILSSTNTVTMNIEPTYVPPPTPVVIEKVIREVIPPAPAPIVVEVPSITNGYYNTTTTTTIPTHTHVDHRVVYSPPKVLPSTNILSRTTKEQWVDPLKYEKIVEGGRTKYVLRTDYINKIMEDQRYGATIYADTIQSPRVQRKSRVMYDTVVKPSYNEVEYIVDSPRIRRSRVLYQDIPTTTIISPTTQILETSFTSPAIDIINAQTRIENGIPVYTRRVNGSPLRRSNVIVDQYTTTAPVQYTTTTTSPTVLRRSFVSEDRVPRRSRVIVQSPEVVEVRRSNSGTRGSRVIRTTAGDGQFYLGNRPVHLVFKKLNTMLGSTSQYFNDPRYTVHKYMGANELAAIARNIPVNQPVVLVVDDVPESIDYFTNHSHFNTVVIPKNRSSYRTQQVKYPKYKWILQEDPERAYGEILTYLDQFAYPSRSNYQRVSRAAEDIRYLSPNNYTNIGYSNTGYSNTGYTSSYNTGLETKHKMVNSSKKVLLFPVNRAEVKDFVQSRLPNMFDFIQYDDMNSLTKQLDYWPGSNLVVVLSEPLAQQIGTATRLSRNADFIVYDPNNSYGYIKQEYNSVKRVRTVHDLVIELQDILGMSTKAEYRRESRSYQI